MDNTGNIDLLTAFKKLLSENKSQEARLVEFTIIVNSRDTEIEMLQTMLSEATEHRSSMDSKLIELKELQHYINDLQHQLAGPVYLATGTQHQVNDVANAELQIRNLHQEYACSKSQLAGLQTQLADLTNRNLLLQQQISRMAELQSLLENARAEIAALKPRNNHL